MVLESIKSIGRDYPSPRLGETASSIERYALRKNRKVTTDARCRY
jgi:hypothetical protein